MATITPTDIIKSSINLDTLDSPDKNRDNVDPKSGASIRGGSAQAAMGANGSQAATAKRVAGTDTGQTFARSHQKGGKTFSVKPDSDIDPVTGLPKSA